MNCPNCKHEINQETKKLIISEYMRANARKGGSQSSEAKTKAVTKNIQKRWSKK